MTRQRTQRLVGVGVAAAAILAFAVATGDAGGPVSDDGQVAGAPDVSRPFTFEANAGEGSRELFQVHGLRAVAKCGQQLADGRPDLSAWVQSKVPAASIALVLGDPDKYTSSFNINNFGPNWGRYDFLGNAADGRVGVLSFIRPDQVRVVVSFNAMQNIDENCVLNGEYRVIMPTRQKGTSG